jgi:hypothetical protein
MYFFDDKFDYIILFDYLSNWKFNQVKQKLTILIKILLVKWDI